MGLPIYTARQQYGVATAAAYRALLARDRASFVRTWDRFGVDVTAATPAYINESRWLIDCECGAGNFVDPDTGLACCYGCGAVHSTVVIPADRAQIEAVLLERPVQNRGWRDVNKAETLDDLKAENIAHGIQVPV